MRARSIRKRHLKCKRGTILFGSTSRPRPRRPCPLHRHPFSNPASSTYPDYLGAMPGLAHFFYIAVLVASARANNTIAATFPNHPTAPHRATAPILADVALLSARTLAVQIHAHPIPSLTNDAIVASTGVHNTIANTSSDHPAPNRRAVLSEPSGLPFRHSFDYLRAPIRARLTSNPARDDTIVVANNQLANADTSSGHPTPLHSAILFKLFSSSGYLSLSGYLNSSDYLSMPDSINPLVAGDHSIAAVLPDHPTTPHRAATPTVRAVVLPTTYPATAPIRARPAPNTARDDAIVAVSLSVAATAPLNMHPPSSCASSPRTTSAPTSVSLPFQCRRTVSTPRP